MTKNVFITGASSGIGRATALKLALEGFNLIISGRRIDKLYNLEKEIQALSKVKTLVLKIDVKNVKETQDIIQNIPKDWDKIDVLINNAGLSLGLSPIHEGLLEDWDNMIDTNVKGLLNVSKVVANKMVHYKEGQIINISSIAGTQVYENGNVYCATKHAVDAITKAMRIDLLKHGIRVSSVSPGAVDTEFSTVRFKGDVKKANQVYNGYKPLLAEDVADSILHVVKSPAHVNINDLVITPTAQANAFYLNRDVYV